MECPHCWEEMERTGPNWKCWSCGAIMCDGAVDSIHYWSNTGIMHRLVNGTCRLVLNI